MAQRRGGQQLFPVRLQQGREITSKLGGGCLQRMFGGQVPEEVTPPGAERDAGSGCLRGVPETPRKQQPVAGLVGQLEGQPGLRKLLWVPAAGCDEAFLGEER